jgi:lipopolysaccharide transport system permease protein
MSEATKNLPVAVIQPQRRWLNFELKEIWQYREMVYYLTLRDIQIRYKQTAIGVVWAVLQPVITTIIFTIIFSGLARFESGDTPYPLFALSGLLIWLYVNNSVNQASMGLITNIPLVTKVYIPRVIVPISMIFSCLLDMLIGAVILIGMAIYYQIAFTPQVFLAPLFILMAIFLSAGVGILFGGINVLFRDVKHALPFMLQIWMFLSPVFYGPEMLTEKWRMVLRFNPMYGILQGFRASLLGGQYDWPAIGYAVVFIAIVFTGGFIIFKRLEDKFADVI